MKLPFSFSLKLVFRLIFPGFILAVSFTPIIQTFLKHIEATMWFETIFVIFVFFMGWAVIIFDMPIYMLFEGRRFWPAPLWKLFHWLEGRRLRRLWEKLDKAVEKRDRNKELEISVEIRKFPINDEGQYDAKCPTRLGNLILAFEEYSGRIYGLDCVFYWPRIWLKLNKHTQDDVDNQQAMTDSVLYITTGLYISGLFSLLYGLLQRFKTDWIIGLPEESTLYLVATICFLSGYFIYRFSLHLFSTFGETFKAIFDIFQEDLLLENIVKEVSEITDNSALLEAPRKLQNKVVWRYLHNYRVKLTEDGESYLPDQLPEKNK